MIKIFKINQNRVLPKQSGMTYVELIVVLGIFAVMSSVVLYNYGDFQAKVDIKNLSSDVALKIVEAQKASLAGKLPTQYITSTWAPSYGVYFDMSSPKQFIYFADLNNASGYEAPNFENIDTISITKNNYISKIEKCTDSGCSTPTNINNLSITFKRPNSGALFTGTSISGASYVRITLTSPKSATSVIKVYPSGRIQLN